METFMYDISKTQQMLRYICNFAHKLFCCILQQSNLHSLSDSAKHHVSLARAVGGLTWCNLT